jgi:hypothetical protein
MPSDVNSVEIVIKRKWAYKGAPIPWKVFVDDKMVGKLAAGGSFSAHAAPGRHTITVRWAFLGSERLRGEFSFDAEVGERIDLVGQAPGNVAPIKIWRSGASPRPPAPSEPTTSTVIEGSRYTVPLGDETRTMDNSQSGSSTTREVRLTREWTRTYVVDVEHITTVRGSAGLAIQVLDLKGEAERTLSKKYSATTEERETFEEKVTVNVAPHTRSEIVFSWKEIRQKGSVRVVGGDFEARIPYEVVVGLTFDQQQIDTP